jgi:hypothetical protein
MVSQTTQSNMSFSRRDYKIAFLTAVKGSNRFEDEGWLSNDSSLRVRVLGFLFAFVAAFDTDVGFVVDLGAIMIVNVKGLSVT